MGKLMKNYDVTIIGAGASGISCAYICAKLGLKTLLIEKESYLGGDMTGGLVIPSMKSDSNNLNTDFYNELVEQAKAMGAQLEYGDGNDGWFNPIHLSVVFDKMLKNVGVDIMFESVVESCKINVKNVDFINISSNMLSIPIKSIYYVDATGNASFSKMLNCNFLTDTEKKQPPSLRFLISNVDLEIFSEFLNSIDNDRNVTTTYLIDDNIHLSTAFTHDEDKNWALTPYFKKALSDGVLKESDLAYFQLFTVPNMPHTVALNCPRLVDYDSNCPLSYSKAIIESRSAILRLHTFLTKYIDGFEKSFISSIANKVGHRETRRVKCKHTFSIEDIRAKKQFDNIALYSNYPLDVHSNKKNESILEDIGTYCLPLESLMSFDYDNLYAVGKILGADFITQAGLRVQKSCMSMGEAVARDIATKLTTKY